MSPIHTRADPAAMMLAMLNLRQGLACQPEDRQHHGVEKWDST